MYEQFYGIHEMPFSLAPDTQYFFCHQGHKQALDVLLVALAAGEGFVKITGEVGTGKTLLCRELLNRLSDGYHTCYIPNPYLSPVSLRKAVAEELAIDTRLMSDHDVINAIYRKLFEFSENGIRVVLCLDEAQAIPDQTLEALRLLSNLETEKRKLIQIVLFGQPELDEKLSRPRNRQLRQRIVYSYELQPLDKQRVQNYLDHRLRVAGYNGDPLFVGEVIDQLFSASGGIPRLVNILSNKALLLAYGKGEHVIKKSHMKQAIDDTDGVVPSSGIGEQIIYISLGLSTLLMLLASFFIWGRI